MQNADYGKKPQRWTLFVIYCTLLAILYLALTIFGIVALIIDPEKLDMNRDEAKIMGVVFIAMGIVFCIPFAIAPFLPMKPWVWVYDLVLICIGLTSLCCIPFSLPLLLSWIKPETKLIFGRT